MNDFNRGALQVPCLRLDYGFGEQWASVELGDGTGYVRLADYEKLASENAKLRELVAHYERAVTVHDVKPVEVLEWSVRCDALRKELGIEVEDA